MVSPERVAVKFAVGEDSRGGLVGLHIVLMGAPGAGKGTQAVRISQRRAVPHISTGDIFRQHIENGSSLGAKVQPFLHEGHLAPDDLAVEVVAQRLTHADCAAGYILDGFPRSVVQARRFEQMLQDRGESIDCVINILVDDDEIVARLSARRCCSNCGAIYNLQFNPPKVSGTCDNPACAGAVLLQREDDYADTIRERLRVYHTVTEPILDHYRDSGVLHDVVGQSSTPDQIFVKIDSLITDSLAAPRS